MSGVDARAVDVVLSDADGTLFDSEPPAFAASTVVTNQLLAEWGIDRTYTPDRLRRWASGRNFRATAAALAAEAGVVLDPATLEHWVVAERRAVVEELSRALRPSQRVRRSLNALAGDFRLAVVTSSARTRLDACLDATHLDDVFPSRVRFSAEDS